MELIPIAGGLRISSASAPGQQGLSEITCGCATVARRREADSFLVPRRAAVVPGRDRRQDRFDR